MKGDADRVVGWVGVVGRGRGIDVECRWNSEAFDFEFSCGRVDVVGEMVLDCQRCKFELS